MAYLSEDNDVFTPGVDKAHHRLPWTQVLSRGKVVGKCRCGCCRSAFTWQVGKVQSAPLLICGDWVALQVYWHSQVRSIMSRRSRLTSSPLWPHACALAVYSNLSTRLVQRAVQVYRCTGVWNSLVHQVLAQAWQAPRAHGTGSCGESKDKIKLLTIL